MRQLFHCDMSANFIYILTLSTIFVNFITETYQQSVVQFKLQPDKLDKRLRNAKIQTIWNVTLAGCARECYYHKACKSMNFNHVENICELNSRNSVEAAPLDFVTDGSFVFSEKIVWPKGVSGECSDDPCTPGQKCIPYKPYQCIAWCGDPLDVRNANYDIGDQTLSTDGAVRTYTCIDRHVLTSPDNTVTCQPDSMWSPVQFKCIANCGTPPTVEHAVISPGPDTENQTRTYTCQGRYVPSTPQTSIVCQMNTYWSDILFKCIANCETPPTVDHATVSSGLNTENQTRTYSCQNRYVSTTQQTTIVCQMNTYWSDILFSCIANCGTPSTVDNAVISSGPDTENMTRTYTCQGRYVSSTQQTSIVCQINTYWSAILFKCIANCGTPPTVGNAAISPGPDTENQTRAYTCQGRYVSSTQHTSIVCQMNTYWSAKLFNCIANCGTPPTVDNAVISNGLETELQTRTYTCQGPHYTPTSQQTSIVCQTNTYWSNIQFSCILTCLTGWTKLHSSCYYFLTSSFSWPVARSICETVQPGGHLADVKSQGVEDVLKNMYYSQSAVTADLIWIGANRYRANSDPHDTDEGPFAWSDGSLVRNGFQNWGGFQDESSNLLNVDCLCYFTSLEISPPFIWVFLVCGAEVPAFCEYEMF